MAEPIDHFQFISGTLNILIIDPEYRFGTLPYAELLSRLSCCKLFYAASNREALAYLKSGTRFHTCITELGIKDIEHDEFYLIRHYGSHSSILVVTDSKSPAKGALSARLGARWVFDKGSTFDLKRFYTVLSRVLLINVVNCRYDESAGDTLSAATKVLLDKQPVSVTEWADKMRITDRQLRNLWHTGSGFGAKQILFLHECFRSALKYYSIMFFSDEPRSMVKRQFFKKQFITYFRNHQDTLLFILS